MLRPDLLRGSRGRAPAAGGVLGRVAIGRAFLPVIAWSLAPALWLEALRVLGGVEFSWGDLWPRWLFVVGALGVSVVGRPYAVGGAGRVMPWPSLAVGVVGVFAALGAIYGESTIAAWVAPAAWYSLLPGVAGVLVGGGGGPARLLGAGLLALPWGVAPVVVAQMEGRFAEEEFFAALQGLELSAFALLLMVAAWRIESRVPGGTRAGLRVRPRVAGVLVAAAAGVGAVVAVRAYQESFYPDTAPPYQGISAASPFLCGGAASPAAGAPSRESGKEVFRRLLARVEANPAKGTPEYGMLALGSGEERWAGEFRRGLLDEASQREFTGPAGSDKAVQRQATLRAYYYGEVHAAFPGLFSPGEQRQIGEWFARINGRAMEVEWVDRLYGLAFGRGPEGPYANQEIGAGLLAALQREGLVAPRASAANQGYLESRQGGWTARFRNSDDDLAYQPEWLRNAYLQSRLGGAIDPQLQRQSFEWLLLQALPDGAPSGYNHPSAVSQAGSAYLGALLLNDPRYVWLAGRAIGALEAGGKPLFAQPGVERASDLTGRPPAEGSCLMYGDSGLPDRLGPLGPDKIVLRDGWSEGDGYLEMNLRFTGWHRYKATGTISLVYQGGPLATEQLDSPGFAWLPRGRALFRDKRIPRENLNGLAVARTGLDAALWGLTGMGGVWAQDPPYYANVERFATGEAADTAAVTIADWRGWQHRRTVALYHGGGPVVVADQARGPQGSRVAIFWHVAGTSEPHEQRLTLRGGTQPAELLVVPAGASAGVRLEATAWGTDRTNVSITPRDDASGQLDAISVFLLGKWVGATATVVQANEGSTLRIVRADGEAVTFELPAPLVPR